MPNQRRVWVMRWQNEEDPDMWPLAIFSTLKKARDYAKDEIMGGQYMEQTSEQGSYSYFQPGDNPEAPREAYLTILEMVLH